MKAKQAVAMASAQAGDVGGPLESGALVRAREAEFWGPIAARKPFRAMHCKLLLAALSGWQMGSVVVCGVRARSWRVLLGRDPAAAFAAGGLAYAGRPGVCSVHLQVQQQCQWVAGAYARERRKHAFFAVGAFLSSS